ncbi:unnamed protein product [Arctogadus glacialis]
MSRVQSSPAGAPGSTRPSVTSSIQGPEQHIWPEPAADLQTSNGSRLPGEASRPPMVPGFQESLPGLQWFQASRRGFQTSNGSRLPGESSRPPMVPGFQERLPDLQWFQASRRGFQTSNGSRLPGEASRPPMLPGFQESSHSMTQHGQREGAPGGERVPSFSVILDWVNEKRKERQVSDLLFNMKSHNASGGPRTSVGATGAPQAGEAAS